MFIACSLAVFQQITGASILTMYMPTVFQEAGFDEPSDAIFQNVIMSLWYVFCTVVALLVVDRLGRKPLLLLGTHGHGRGNGDLGRVVPPAHDRHVCRSDDVSGDGRVLVSLAPLAWLIMSEIFPNRLRGKAMAVASVCVWTASFLTAKYFPPMVDWFKTTYGTPAMAFWIYAAVSRRGISVFAGRRSGNQRPHLEEIGASWNKTHPLH